MKGEALKGHLDLMLLAVLSHQPLHGYAVIERLRNKSGDTFDLPEGTIYPALHRLEREKLIKSRWESGPNARRRRLYTVTSAGERRLAKRRGEWESFARAMRSVIEDAG